MLVDVTDVRSERGGATAVKYTWKWTLTKMAEAIGYTPAAAQEATARLQHSDSGDAKRRGPIPRGSLRPEERPVQAGPDDSPH